MIFTYIVELIPVWVRGLAGRALRRAGETGGARGGLARIPRPGLACGGLESVVGRSCFILRGVVSRNQVCSSLP